jgi:hypothetical protein
MFIATYRYFLNFSKSTLEIHIFAHNSLFARKLPHPNLVIYLQTKFSWLPLIRILQLSSLYNPEIFKDKNEQNSTTVASPNMWAQTKNPQKTSPGENQTDFLLYNSTMSDYAHSPAGGVHRMYKK